MKRPQLALILAFLTAGFATGTILLGARLASAVMTLQWQETTGVLQNISRERVRGEVYDQWIVSYTYTVNEITFTGNRLDYRLFDIGLHFDELEAAYREGRPVRLYVDRAHPERAVLKQGPGFTLPLAFAIALGMTSGVIFLASVIYRTKSDAVRSFKKKD